MMVYVLELSGLVSDALSEIDDGARRRRHELRIERAMEAIFECVKQERQQDG